MPDGAASSDSKWPGGSGKIQSLEGAVLVAQTGEDVGLVEVVERTGAAILSASPRRPARV